MQALGWIRHRQFAPGLWGLTEPGHVTSWLVAGDERAALIDTGLGVAPIRPLAERLARRPVAVLNTHHHFDHVGGNHEWSGVAIHRLGARRLARPPPPERLAHYRATTDPPPPAGWRVRPSRAGAVLEDGDRVGLGGRALMVLHTPGHTPDSICLLEMREGWLFAGDTVNRGALYAHLPESDLAAFARSAARVAELAAGVRLVLAAHVPEPIEGAGVLVETAAALRCALAADVPARPARDVLGLAMREVAAGGVTVTLPPEGGRAGAGDG